MTELVYILIFTSLLILSHGILREYLRDRLGFKEKVAKTFLTTALALVFFVSFIKSNFKKNFKRG